MRGGYVSLFVAGPSLASLCLYIAQGTTVYICPYQAPPRSVRSRMSVLSLLRVFLLVLPILSSSAETELEEVEEAGPAMEAQSPHTKPWSPPVNTGRGPWMGQPGQALGRPWSPRPWGPQPSWRPQPRQWSGPMGHVVPSFNGPRQNNGLWQAPPPVVQQVM